MCLNVALFCAVLKQKFASFSTIPSSYIVTKPVALAARSITWLLGRGQFSSILAHFFIVCSDSGLRAEIPCRSLLLVALVLIIHNATYLLTNFFPTKPAGINGLMSGGSGFSPYSMTTCGSQGYTPSPLAAASTTSK